MIRTDNAHVDFTETRSNHVSFLVGTYLTGSDEIQSLFTTTRFDDSYSHMCCSIAFGVAELVECRTPSRGYTDLCPELKNYSTANNGVLILRTKSNSSGYTEGLQLQNRGLAIVVPTDHAAKATVDFCVGNMNPALTITQDASYGSVVVPNALLLKGDCRYALAPISVQTQYEIGTMLSGFTIDNINYSLTAAEWAKLKKLIADS